MITLINKKPKKVLMFLYITCKDKKEAEFISKELLKRKLIACSNFFPIKSMYSWKGKIESQNEYVMIAKTNPRNAKKAQALADEIHSYDIPCIARINSSLNKEFEAWANSVMK